MPRPRTRAQGAATDPEPAPADAPVEAQGRGRRRRGQVNLREAPPPEVNFEEEDNSLHLIQGCYGIWDAKKGFTRLTNFCMEPVGFISSKKFILKGNLWDLSFVSGERARIFVPENQQSQPQKFKYFFDTQHVEIRMKLRAGDQAWREFVDRLLDSAEERPAGYKKMFFMEKMGFQDHTADEHPDNPNMWRWQFGPNLHFTFDGQPDSDPLHFMFPTLSTKYLAPKDWKFLPFNFRTREDLQAPLLIEAAPEWNFWQFMLTCALFISGSNTYLVRKRVKQHPAGIIKGGKGVTKTWSVEVIMWQLAGQKGEDKLDPGARDSTIKRLAAFYSTPTVIEDNASSNKEEALVTSSFDACKYITKEEIFEMRSIFIFTTNSRVRGERMTDRECIIEYERGNPSEEEREASRLAYLRARDSDQVAVRLTMAFGRFILSDEWMNLVSSMTKTLMNCFGVKERTARGYAVVIAALRYLYDRNEEFFLNRSHPWTEFMEVFLPGQWAKVVRHAHIELTNADVTFASWMKGLLPMIATWSLSERKRALALATSNKVSSGTGQEAVFAIKVTEPRFKCVGGVPLESLAKIAEELKGISDHPCSKFLAPGIQLEDGETEITAGNRKSSRAILFPIKVACNSQQILTLCDLLDEPDFRQFADVDTPSGNFDSQYALSSSVQAGMSALNIADVSAITVVNKTGEQHNLSSAATFRCDVCEMICKNSAGLQNHKGSKNCQEKQRKNSTSLEDNRCIECSRHFSTVQGLASHVRSHRSSLNLALTVTSSPHSQTLPAARSPSSTICAPTSPATAALPSYQAVATDHSTVSDASTTPGSQQSSATGHACDLCGKSLKSKAAFIKHRDSASCKKAAAALTATLTPTVSNTLPTACSVSKTLPTVAVSGPYSIPTVGPHNLSAPGNNANLGEIKCPMCAEGLVNVTAFKIHVLKCSGGV